MKNTINWFEIPVTDFERAKKFYATILDAEVVEMSNPAMKYAFLPFDMDAGGVGGGLVAGEGYEPSQTGTLVYLNGGDDLDVILSRVEPAGGKVVMPKFSIGSNGFTAIFNDTEGNRVGLHSMK